MDSRTKMPRGLAAALVLAAAAAGAAEFSPTLRSGGDELVLKTSGTAWFAGVFHVYDAALYGRPGASAREIVAGGAPRCLVLEYKRTVTRDKIVTAAEKVLGRQQVDLAPLRERIDRLHGAYRDVSKGDRYALCHAPGADTRLTLNGETLAIVPGDDFAAAYFGIWLREGAISDSLREALIGDEGTRGRS
jgi:hypothetical protein